VTRFDARTRTVQLWNQDQLAKLQEWGIYNKGDNKVCATPQSKHVVNMLTILLFRRVSALALSRLFLWPRARSWVAQSSRTKFRCCTGWSARRAY